MTKRNYILKINIPKQDLDETKRPPICDMCNSQFSEEENGIYTVYALILNNSVWGVICENDAKNTPKLPILEEKENREAARATRYTLSQPMSITFIEG